MNKDSGKCPATVTLLGTCPECGGDAEVHTLYANAEAEATCEIDGEVTLYEFHP